MCAAVGAGRCYHATLCVQNLRLPSLKISTIIYSNRSVGGSSNPAISLHGEKGRNCTCSYSVLNRLVRDVRFGTVRNLFWLSIPNNNSPRSLILPNYSFQFDAGGTCDKFSGSL